jgi:NAD(P)-dependent dehydrogenase (short-subunit alcohol dehydrogenase family)
MVHWTETDIPDQHGRTALVTGASGGLGLRIAEALAGAGARVILGSRDALRGSAAQARVSAAKSGRAPEPEVVSLDLASLESVRSAASALRRLAADHLDILVNNAGIMAPPLSFAESGIELQWATNVVGPAALTWLLLPAIEATPGARVVWVSSDRHRHAQLSTGILRSDARGENYRGFDYYGRTKLADLLLSRELERFFHRHRVSAISVAAHPGFTATSIVGSGFAGLPPFAHRIATAAAGVLGQSVRIGALPILYAATAPGVHGSQYFGPRGPFELRGLPAPATRSVASRSDELGALLVAWASDLSGVPAPD